MQYHSDNQQHKHKNRAILREHTENSSISFLGDTYLFHEITILAIKSHLLGIYFTKSHKKSIKRRTKTLDFRGEI